MSQVTVTVDIPDEEIDAFVSASWQQALSGIEVDKGECFIHIFEDDHSLNLSVTVLAEKLANDIRNMALGDKDFYDEQAKVSIMKLREAADIIEAAHNR